VNGDMVMVTDKQTAMEAAYQSCYKHCPNPAKCPKNGLIFAENCFFQCPDYHVHQRTRAIQKKIDQFIPETLQGSQLENYQPQNDSQQNLMAVIRRYFKKEAWKKGLGVVISGPVGLGKSHVAVAMYKKLIQKGITAAFAGPKTTGDFKSIEHYYKQLEKPKVLIYDDMGTELRKDFIIDFLFTLFDKRLSANKGVIITTNMIPNVLQNMLGPRIHSRLVEKNYFLEIEGDDYRKRKRELF